MSNLLADYAQNEKMLKELQQKLERMQNDPRLQSELEFKEKLEALMDKYEKSSREVLELLNPDQNAKPVEQAGQRRKRKLKIFENPTTGEVVETRGGNQKTLKAWKEEHGDEAVESWLVRTED